MEKFKKIKAGLIIHVFALLHASVATLCRLVGVGDELFLTTLTMLMVLVICLRRNFSIELIAAGIIVVNVVGYLLGNMGATILEKFLESQFLVHALATALTTEILGWTMVAFTKIFPRGNHNNNINFRSSYVKWALLAVGAIFIIRICIFALSDANGLFGGDFLTISGEVLSNSAVIVTTICLNLLYVRLFVPKLKDKSSVIKTSVLCGYILLETLLSTAFVMSGLPFRVSYGLGGAFPITFSTSLLLVVTVYCIVYMLNYGYESRRQIKEARNRANLAQYRYMKLKQQVNPHFLFNSLNVLDFLVCEGKTEESSLYIHKLAGLYRYMIKSETEDLVTLRDELEFANSYVDLLKVRFPEGFDVIVDVPQESLGRLVLPCSLQLLVENATKHNAVSVEKPLTIEIKVDSDKIIVSNPLIPKVTSSSSIGVGLKYIRQQYLDLADKHISIEKTEDKYSVTLPLL